VDVPTFRSVYGSDVDLPEEVWERWTGTRTGCIVGEDLVAREGFKVGGKVPIEGNIWGGRIELEIVGIYRSKVASFDQSTLFFHWDYLNEASKAAGGRSELVSTFTILLEDPERSPAVAAAVDAHFESSDSRTRTLTERAFSSQFNSMWGNLPLYFGVLATVALVACLMVTANTMYLNAKERVREIGILKTLGFTPTTVAALSLVESLILCLTGGVLALLLVGALDGKTLIFVVAAVPLSTYLEGFAITLALALISGIFPALAARKLPVAEALRRTA
jgi:putative ABC transport system permease protein